MTLPVPLNRTELFLAKIAGEDVTPPEPQSRQEMFLAKLAGADIVLPEPLSLTEQWLALCAGMAGVTAPEIEGACLIGVQKVDVRFFAVASGLDGVTAPEPQNRTEEFWAKIAEEMSVKTITVKGTYLHLLKVVSGIDDLQYVYGDTSQQTYTGKNLFNINITPNWIGADTTYSVSGNTLHVEGNWFVGILTPVEANTDYYVSATRKNLSGGNQTGYISVYGGKNTDMIAAFQTSNGTFNSGNRTSVYLVFYADSGTEGNYADFENIQLEKGTTGTDYEPYVGGTASPNPDYPQDVKVVTGEQTVKVTGKNFWGGDNPLVQTGATTYPINLPAGTYTISATSITTTGEEHNFRMALYYSDGTYVAGNLNDTRYYLQLTATQAVTSMGIYSQSSYPSSQGVTTTFTNFMINSSSTVGNYKLNLGKNLFDKATATVLSGAINSDLTYTSGGNARTVFIPCEPNTKYSASKIDRGSRSRLGSCTGRIDTDGGSLTYYTQTYNDVNSRRIVELTTGPNDKYLYFTFGQTSDAATIQDLVDSIQIEVGDATPYAPYFTPIELCKIGTYQDYIYKSGSDWYVHKAIKKVVLDGTTGYYGVNTDSTNTTRVVAQNTISDAPAVVPIVLPVSDYFIGKSMWSVDEDGVYATGNDIVFRGEKTTIGTTSDAVKAWLLAHTPAIYYVLATATDTQITDTDLIAQLNALDSAILPTPEAFVTVSGNLPAPIQFTYEGKE